MFSVGATALKYGSGVPAAAAAVNASQYVPPFLVLLAGLAGLIGGAIWRVGYLRDKGVKARKALTDDLINSALAAGVNAILVLVLIVSFEGGVLVALCVGAVVGGTGVRALVWVYREVQRGRGDPPDKDPLA